MSSWLGRAGRECEGLKAAQAGVMVVTGGQIQLYRDELESLTTKTFSLWKDLRGR